MKKVHLKHIPMYILVAFLVGSIIFVFTAPIFVVKKIQEDSKKPKEQRELIYRGDK
ncbi:hypothetical protein [Nitrosophilus labii]|uniref:hypothetical protein n=1 Tax=Nitrosophilus labii TaxID=2706014 RepID=UPI0016576432|nr:hypothetical protein [Nitrosophilus labii]